MLNYVLLWIDGSRMDSSDPPTEKATNRGWQVTIDVKDTNSSMPSYEEIVTGQAKWLMFELATNKQKSAKSRR